ncbi:MAG: carbon-nitrogen hydrolase family protein [Hyphococcus sp.]
MKVTVCQIDPDGHELDGCLDHLSAHIASHNSDFLLLPEMCFSPWLAADPTPDPEKWAASVEAHARYMARLGALGAKAVMGARPITNAEGARRNEAYLWTRENDRAVGVHEKYYLPNEEGYWEAAWYERGPKSFEPAHALGMTIGVQICTEMWFFEWARAYGAAGADVLCVPRATPHETTQKWLTGGQAAAVSSGAYCLSSNLWRPKGAGANCGGLAWVVDPEGNILAQTDEDNPFATVDIDLEFAKASKSTYPRYVKE